MIIDTIFYLLAVLAVLLIGISKSGFGSGLAVLGVPLMALVISPAKAAAILLPLLIVMDDDIDIIASFAAESVTLAVDTEGMGSVDINPDQSGDYQYGDTDTLTPVPVQGWAVDHWEGDVEAGDENDNQLELQLKSDTELTAVFEERPLWLFLPVIMK